MINREKPATISAAEPIHAVTVNAKRHYRVWRFSFENLVDNEAIAKFILKYRRCHSKRMSTALNCWQSGWHLDRETTALDNLIHHIQAAANIAVGRHRANNGYRVYVTECWAAIYRFGESANWHDHGNVQYSGVYYVAASDVHRPIKFEDDYSIAPVTGTFVMFDGGYKHLVPRSKSTQPRIVIGVNLLQVPGFFFPRAR